MNISLHDCQWKVKGYWPYVPFLGKSIELGNELMGVTDWMEACVPGGVHADLIRAGYLEDPYFEMNSLKCEWVENRWWMYRTNFPLDPSLQGRKLELIFKGLDYKAHVYLNKRKIGEHEGMYEAAVFDVTDLVCFGLEAENELVVLLESVPDEMAQIGYTSQTWTQKSRYNYKWDFSTRMVNIGIWDDVLIKASGEVQLVEPYVKSTFDGDGTAIQVEAGVKGRVGSPCRLDISLYDGNECLGRQEEQITAIDHPIRLKAVFPVKDPKYWYPNGLGEQPLYRVEIRLYDWNGLSDEQQYHTGIRKLEYRKNEGSPEDALPYTVVINDIPVYIKGVNLVPFDMLYGNVSTQTYDDYVFMLRKANINLVRIWGGGIIEKEYFYQLCDRYGILIWQEFIQSSSGVDNIPSTDPHFLKLLKATALQAVKTRRNHVSHAFWSGGNELMDAEGIPVTYANPNIAMLKEIVEEYDPGKLFLPTSASGPQEFLNIEDPGRNHDVHGNWKYEGVERQCTVFNHSDSLLHSEFGVDGLSSVESLKGFMGPEHLKVTDMKQDLVWRHHGEWWDTLERDTGIFGEFDSLEQFVKASQFIQAEGIRYALEANRRRQFQNSGSIIWQFNEPWPNVSCTCLMEHAGSPKMAYYWVAGAYAPIHASMRYERLYVTPQEDFKAELFLHNSQESAELVLKWEILGTDGTLADKGETTQYVPFNSVSSVKELCMRIGEMPDDIFLIRLRVLNTDGKLYGENLYLFSQRQEKIFSPLMNLKAAQVRVEKAENGYLLSNVGDVAALFIHGRAAAGEACCYIDGNYTSLFPGESRLFTVEAATKGDRETELEWKWFNQYR